LHVLQCIICFTNTKTKATADRTSQELAKVLTQPEMVQRLAGFNVQAKACTPAQLAQLLDSDIKRWSEVIAKAGLTPQ
jgi:tripartite-type tricarboxylate transporter receptor subunit TctC